jgi:hypothetical protein
MLEDFGIIVKPPETSPHVANFATIHLEDQDYYNYCPATFCGDGRSHDADYLCKSIGSNCIDMASSLFEVGGVTHK